MPWFKKRHWKPGQVILIQIRNVFHIQVISYFYGGHSNYMPALLFYYFAFIDPILDSYFEPFIKAVALLFVRN